LSELGEWDFWDEWDAGFLSLVFETRLFCLIMFEPGFGRIYWICGKLEIQLKASAAISAVLAKSAGKSIKI